MGKGSIRKKEEIRLVERERREGVWGFEKKSYLRIWQLVLSFFFHSLSSSASSACMAVCVCVYRYIYIYK